MDEQGLRRRLNVSQHRPPSVPKNVRDRTRFVACGGASTAQVPQVESPSRVTRATISDESSTLLPVPLLPLPRCTSVKILIIFPPLFTSQATCSSFPCFTLRSLHRVPPILARGQPNEGIGPYWRARASEYDDGKSTSPHQSQNGVSPCRTPSTICR